jgi:hypothetical protein
MLPIGGLKRPVDGVTARGMPSAMLPPEGRLFERAIIVHYQPCGSDTGAALLMVSKGFGGNPGRSPSGCRFLGAY